MRRDRVVAFQENLDEVARAMSQIHFKLQIENEDDLGGVAVRIRNLTKQFGFGDQRVQALAGIALDIYAGQMSLIVGPSGCGKTTLLSVVAGILDADQGEVSIFGSDITRMSDRAKT